MRDLKKTELKMVAGGINDNVPNYDPKTGNYIPKRIVDSGGGGGGGGGGSSGGWGASGGASGGSNGAGYEANGGYTSPSGGYIGGTISGNTGQGPTIGVSGEVPFNP